MKIVLVAEAWGRREAQFQHALVGPSGRELTLQMGIAELSPYMTLLCRKCKRETFFINSRCQFCKELIWPNEFNLIEHWKKLRSEHQIAVTNVFNTQPPNNDLGFFFGTSRETEMPPWKASKTSIGTHVKAEHFHHVKRLWNELESLNPTLIIALGNAACWATIFQTKITALRGTVTWSDKLGIKVLPTFHPAAVLRQLPMRPTVIADLQKARREAEFREIKRKERFFTIPSPDSDGIREIDEWLKKPARAYANDIETIKGQISIIGFARSNDDALIVPFREDSGQSYWPTEELEFAAWKSVIRGLESPIPKIFQNGIYDLSYFIKMGIHPRNAAHDTMLWHHALYPELPKSLGFLGSVYCNEVSWKLMRRRETLKRDE